MTRVTRIIGGMESELRKNFPVKGPKTPLFPMIRERFPSTFPLSLAHKWFWVQIKGKLQGISLNQDFCITYV
jgi:hypothetical protein